MILIADSGSTKCDWILYKNKESNPLKIRTKGLNPAVLTKKYFLKIVASNKELDIVKEQVKEVKFFGAGCGSKSKQQKVNRILASFFTNAKCATKEDTMIDLVVGFVSVLIYYIIRYYKLKKCRNN